MKCRNRPTAPKSFPAGRHSGRGALQTPTSWAPAGYLLYQLPPGPPPSRLHGDDNAFSEPVLGGGACRLLCRLCDAQPALQLCKELLLGRAPAQGGRVQPAARGGFPGHGMHVARLPAPPDHGADLGGEGGGDEGVTVPSQVR